MTVLAGLFLATLTGFALEPVYTQPVVNRWDIVKFKVPYDLAMSLASVFERAEEYLLTDDRFRWLLPGLYVADSPLPPIEQPKERMRTEEYAVLSDWNVTVERSDRAIMRKRWQPAPSLGKLNPLRGRPLAA
jgi:hypothetical protein